MALENDFDEICWGTVVYPEGFRYFGEFIESIELQSIRTFRLLIINENVDDEIIVRTMNDKGMDLSYEIVPAAETGSAVRNRVQLLREAKKRNTGLLILGDCDDTFSHNRTENVIGTFHSNPSAAFVYNEIIGSDRNSVMPELPEMTDSLSDIAEYNYLGMSNTAIDMSLLEVAFIDSLIEYDNLTFDWYLHCRLLMQYGCGIKADGAFTYYRLHENNVAGIRRADRDNLLYEYDIKLNHYLKLKSYDPLFDRLYKRYSSLNIDQLCDTYLNEVVEDNAPHYWWDLIRLEDEDEIQ